MSRRDSTTHAGADAVSLEGVINLAEFRAALRLFQRRSEEIARRFGLTPQRYLLLLMVKGAADGSERLNLTQIADRLQLSRNTATELVDRAEDAGLVERASDDRDQRVVYVHLTAEGERRLCGAVVEGQIYRDELSRGFSALTRSYRALSPGGRRGS